MLLSSALCCTNASQFPSRACDAYLARGKRAAAASSEKAQQVQGTRSGFESPARSCFLNKMLELTEASGEDVRINRGKALRARARVLERPSGGAATSRQLKQVFLLRRPIRRPGSRSRPIRRAVTRLVLVLVDPRRLRRRRLVGRLVGRLVPAIPGLDRECPRIPGLDRECPRIPGLDRECPRAAAAAPRLVEGSSARREYVAGAASVGSTVGLYVGGYSSASGSDGDGSRPSHFSSALAAYDAIFSYLRFDASRPHVADRCASRGVAATRGGAERRRPGVAPRGVAATRGVAGRRRPGVAPRGVAANHASPTVAPAASPRPAASPTASRRGGGATRNAAHRIARGVAATRNATHRIAPAASPQAPREPRTPEPAPLGARVHDVFEVVVVDVVAAERLEEVDFTHVESGVPEACDSPPPNIHAAAASPRLSSPGDIRVAAAASPRLISRE